VHLVVLGMQQDRSTVSASIVNGVRACDENGRCIYYIFDAPGFHYSQCSFGILHGRRFLSAGAYICADEKIPALAKTGRGILQVEGSTRRLLGSLPYLMD
jgi:hypothetical protein